jgi:parallel beta-helix repeat protein
MATYATLTVPVLDIIGAEFNASRASVWIEPNVPLVIADSIRVGGRREQVVNGVATFTNLVTTNSADNPTSFGYRVTITAPPKGAAGRKDIVTLTTSDFPLTASANLKDISAAWDNIAIPPNWQSDFRDEMEAIRDETATISGLTGEDAAVAFLVEDAGSATAGALSATYEAQAAAPSGGDDRATLNALLAANVGKVVRLQRGATYTVSDQIAVSSGTTIEGNAATITQTGTNKVTIDIAGSNVTVRNLRLAGKATDYVSGGAVTAVGINVGTSSAVRLEGLRLTGHAGAGVKIVNSTDVTVDRCTIVGTTPGAGDGTQMGVYVDSSAARVTVSNCDISATAQGVISGVSVTDLRVVNNNIHDIPGQHGLYIQSGTRTVIMGNAIRNCGLNGIKFQLQTSATADSYGLTITGNVVDTTGDQGIILTTTDAAVTRMFYDVTITGNVVRNPASSGIYLDAVSRANVIGNIIDNADLHGIYITRASDLVIASTVIEDVARVGIFLNTGAERVHMRDNRINNPAGANFASTQYGIYILAGDAHLLDGNQITADNGFMVYGIFFGAGGQASSTWRNNRVSGATAYGARLIAATAVRAWTNNDLSGTTGRVLNLPASGAGQRAREEFASAAPTSGTYAVGDRVWNTAPAASGSMGWVCTTAGSPGTWKTFGAISA